mmetsp:Transcript_23786/g.42847  ORF Transcript_23786/g.42847 Transcript_23786/m.42847 type:complete len:110 (-) Transcript_23786:50-379(-)
MSAAYRREANACLPHRALTAAVRAIVLGATALALYPLPVALQGVANAQAQAGALETVVTVSVPTTYDQPRLWRHAWTLLGAPTAVPRGFADNAVIPTPLACEVGARVHK